MRELDQFFDVSFAYDAEEARSVEPVPPLPPNTRIGYGEPTRDDFAAMLAQAVRDANIEQWDIVEGKVTLDAAGGVVAHINPGSLRQPTPAEARGLFAKLKPAAGPHVIRAARLRRWVAKLDKKRVVEVKTETSGRRESLEAQLAKIGPELEQYDEIIKRNSEAAARHEARQRDHDAYDAFEKAQFNRSNTVAERERLKRELANLQSAEDYKLRTKKTVEVHDP